MPGAVPWHSIHWECQFLWEKLLQWSLSLSYKDRTITSLLLVIPVRLYFGVLWWNRKALEENSKKNTNWRHLRWQGKSQRDSTKFAFYEMCYLCIYQWILTVADLFIHLSVFLYMCIYQWIPFTTVADPHIVFQLAFFYFFFFFYRAWKYWKIWEKVSLFIFPMDLSKYLNVWDRNTKNLNFSRVKFPAVWSRTQLCQLSTFSPGKLL